MIPLLVRGDLMAGFVAGLGRGETTVVPGCLDDWVDENNSVRAVDVFVEALDLRDLGFEGVDAAGIGRPSYRPGVLLKLYIYGYLNRVQSSRRLEREAGCPCRKPIDRRLTENRAMLICNEISFQAHGLGGCRSVSVAGSARGRDFNVAATDHCSATNRPQEANFRCHRPIGVRWSLSPLPSRS